MPAVAALGGYGLHAVLRLIDATAVSDLYPKALLATLAAAIIFAVVASLSARFRPSALHVAPLFAAAIIVVAIWDLMTALLVVDVAGGPKLPLLPMPYFPSPELVLQGLVDDRWMLLESAYYSFRLLLSGYAVGVLAGLTTGVLMGWFKQVRYWGMPILKFVGPIPATAFIPLAMIIFDEPFFSGVALIALAVWFPVTMLTTSGIANVPASYFDVARTLGAGRRFLVFRVAIPAAMPSMFIGLFMGMGAAFLTLIVAETVGVRAGLGWYFKLQKDYFEFGKVYASLLIMAVFFSGLMTLLFKIRDRVLGWQKGVIRW
ncbi:MAG TPA: ABC transporter permease subunit [Pirellulales bacterium]|nr:ABC transporter permease subunit [Pirellulales bacterium]